MWKYLSLRIRQLRDLPDEETAFLHLAADHADLARRQHLIDRHREVLRLMLSHRLPTFS